MPGRKPNPHIQILCYQEVQLQIQAWIIKLLSAGIFLKFLACQILLPKSVLGGKNAEEKADLIHSAILTEGEQIGTP